MTPNQLKQHDWSSELHKIQEFSETHGFEVFLEKEVPRLSSKDSIVDKTDFSKKTIVLNSSRVPRNIVYICAHELGHVLVRKKYVGRILKRFPGYACAENSKEDRVSRVEEEVLAWNEAYKILHSLQIPIDESAFNRLKQTCLSTYINS